MNDTLARFEVKYIHAKNGCWQWIAAINRYGYGHFMMRNPKRMGVNTTTISDIKRNRYWRHVR